MKVLMIIIIVMLILAILSILILANKLVALDDELKKLDKQFKESSFDIAKLICYRDGLEKRIEKFNIKYSNDKELINAKIHNEVDIINRRISSINMNLGKVRNAFRLNTDELITLIDKLNEHLEK